MKLKDAEGWQKSVEVNKDDRYGAAVTAYAESWANLMEERMAGDVTILPSIAKRASHDTNVKGITRFMYGCAVSILSDVWEHGEALRQWHNLDTRAVLNPALLNLG